MATFSLPAAGIAANLGVYGSLASGALSAISSITAADAQGRAANFQAAVAENNATLAKQGAVQAQAQGASNEQTMAIKDVAGAGAILAGQAASNIDVNSGSAADVQRSQKTITAMDLTQIRSNAAKTAYDYSVKSVMDTNQASLDVMAGQNAKTSGDISAMSSILGSVSSVSSKWLQGSQQGLFNA